MNPMNLIAEALMTFIAFGGVFVLFATIIGLPIWLLIKMGDDGGP